MESKKSKNILMQLLKAKDDVKRLDAEYRKVCECNEKIPGVKFDEKSFQETYKTCSYHKVRYYHNAKKQHYANV